MTDCPNCTSERTARETADRELTALRDEVAEREHAALREGASNVSHQLIKEKTARLSAESQLTEYRTVVEAAREARADMERAAGANDHVRDYVAWLKAKRRLHAALSPRTEDREKL